MKNHPLDSKIFSKCGNRWSANARVLPIVTESRACYGILSLYHR